MNASKYLKYLGAVVLLLLVFGSGYALRDRSAQTELTSIIKDRDIQLQAIEVTKIKNTTLVKALAGAEESREVLLDELASVRDRPVQVKYITRVETVVLGAETVVVNDLPEHHLFKLSNGLPVAEFLTMNGENDSGAEYHFNTADLTVRGNIIIAENDSAISLRIESDIDPGTEYEIKVEEFNVEHIRDQKLFEVHALVGASGSVGATGFSGGPHAGVTLLHPKDGLDLVHIRLGTTGGDGSGPGFTAGIDPVLYNLGESLPVITNLWISAGPTVSADGWAGTISIGAKL